MIYLMPILIVCIAMFAHYAVQQHKLIRNIQQRLEALSHFAGIPEPYLHLPSDVWQAIRKGQRSEAIRLYQTANACSMVQAQKAIRELFPREKSTADAS